MFLETHGTERTNCYSTILIRQSALLGYDLMDALYILYLSDTVRSLVRTSGRRSLRDHCPHAHPVPSLVPSASDVVCPSTSTTGARYVPREHQAPAEQHAPNVRENTRSTLHSAIFTRIRIATN